MSNVGEVFMGNDKKSRIKIEEHGPYEVSGAHLLKMRMTLNPAGRPAQWESGEAIAHEEEYLLCRCGGSGNKPFCDWSHSGTGFEMTETAKRTTARMKRRVFKGSGIHLTDIKKLCVHAGFCVTKKTDVWELIKKTDDPAAREELIEMVGNCPSGRLEYTLPPDNTPVEEDLPLEIGVVENGPLYVRGGIPVEGADGQTYETRNRVTLCRCGASKNKPYCDGMHVEVGFKG